MSGDHQSTTNPLPYPPLPSIPRKLNSRRAHRANMKITNDPILHFFEECFTERQVSLLEV